MYSKIAQLLRIADHADPAHLCMVYVQRDQQHRLFVSAQNRRRLTIDLGDLDSDLRRQVAGGGQHEARDCSAPMQRPPRRAPNPAAPIGP
jgi:hypothetical protein